MKRISRIVFALLAIILLAMQPSCGLIFSGEEPLPPQEPMPEPVEARKSPLPDKVKAARKEAFVFDKLYWGMTLDQIKEAYPLFRGSSVRFNSFDQSKVEVGETDINAFGIPFTARLSLGDKSLTLEEIRLVYPAAAPADPIENCNNLLFAQESILQALSDKYGQPEVRTEEKFSRLYKYASWKSRDTVVNLVLMEAEMRQGKSPSRVECHLDIDYKMIH